jgi:hypothetical protein
MAEDEEKGTKKERPDRPDDSRGRYPDPKLFEKRPEPEPVAEGEPVDPPKRGKWSEAIDDWLAEREKEREEGVEEDECGRPQRRPRRPRPYLDATSNFGPQITALTVGQPGTVSFTVWNDGNFPAWTCYVDVYEGPGGYTSPLSSYELRGRRIITLHPGERREVSLSWVRQQGSGRIVGVVYDPLLDARDFAVVEQFNRHITSVHYTNLE